MKKQTDFRLLALSLVGVIVVCGYALGQDAYDVADRIDLTPTPREITLGEERIDLDGWRILLAEDFGLCRVGAEEINTRLAALGSRTLPVVSTLDARVPRIVIGSCDSAQVRSVAESLDVELSPDSPGEQGYVIACGKVRGIPTVLAGGSDLQGALYACITLCRLIKDEGDQVCLLSARVRDWPDFKIRCNSNLNLRLIPSSRRPETMAKIAADLKKQIDSCLRHKINYVNVNAYSAERVSNERTREARRQMVDVCRYANSRGVRTRVIGNTEIGSYLTPTQKKDAVVRSPGTSFAWSALDAHRRRARDLAAYFRDARIGVFALHPVDSGGYIDPETWSRRSPECRAMYGDDRAKASLEQFQLYFDIIREQCPDIDLEAVSYPYHYQFAMPEFVEQAQTMGADMPSTGWVRGIEEEETARQVQKELCDYHRYLGAGLARDVTVTFREAGRDIFLACGDLYEGHPVTIWIYPDRNKGWRGTFCPQVRMAKTFWRSGMRDHYFVASSWARGNDARVQQLAQQEYLWQVDRPDAGADFDASSRWYETEGCRVTDFQRERLIPRICRELYGPAAPAFQKLVTANVSLNYILEPESVGSERGENFAGNMSHMAEQAGVLAGLHNDFTRILADVHNEASYPEDTLAWALYWQKFSGIAAIKAFLHVEIEKCRVLLAKGDTDPAQQRIKALRVGLPMLQARCDAIHAQVDRDPRNTVEAGYSGSVDNQLHVFKPSEMTIPLDYLEERVIAAAALGTIPSHVQSQLKDREIRLCRFNPAFEVKADAKRGEGSWLNSQTVDFFTVGENRLAEFETIGWIVWDDRALYFYFEIFDPHSLDRKPVVSRKVHDGSVFQDDCFEIFLDTKSDGDNYFHFAVSSSGAKYDAIKHGPNGTDAAWDGDWTAAVARGKDRWIAEIYIPFSTLGSQPDPGETWSVNLARHRVERPGDQRDEYSNIIGSEQNHRPDLFLPMLFTGESSTQSPRDVRAFVEGVKRYDQTTTYGYSTFLEITPAIESDRSLVNHIVRFQVTDSQAKVIAERTIDAVRIPGRWSPSKPILMDLGQAFTGDLTLSALCGTQARPRQVASFTINVKGQVAAE